MAKRKSSTSTASTKEVSESRQPSLAAAQGEGYTVLARRYRPQQFADIIGQEAVAQALVNALEGNRVAHAYLFTGARGVGKTSTARILAKALNCVKGPTATPCGVCDICKAIAAGEDVDVVEIDGASNRQIDDVREIRQNVQYRPNRARYKIYIIDEVHMLTKEAFNALLKTLEEPPPHVKFIFATTDVHKVPVTILSRCQRFDFAGIGMTAIVDRLRQIVTEEKMAADDDALELIARRAGGSMRDAQSLLDQLLAFGGAKLTTDQVHRLLGTAPDDRVVAIVGAILEHDPKRVLQLLDEAENEGLQLGELLDQLLEYWRDLMVVHCAGGEARALSISSRHRETMARQAAGQNLETIMAGLDMLAGTKNRLRGSSHARVWMEMTLVRMCRLEDLQPLADLAQSLASAGSDKPSISNASGSPTTPRPKLADSLPAKAETRSMPSAKSVLPASRTSSGAAAATVPPAPAPLILSEATLRQVWPQIIEQLPRNLAMALEKADIPAISGPNNLVIRFGSEYNSFQSHFLDLGGIEKLAQVLKSCSNRAWHVHVGVAGGQAGGVVRPSEQSDTAGLAVSRQQREDAALKEPLVRRAKDVLKASFGTVDDSFGSASGVVSENVEQEER
jgi:DNA polymerase-3 subunit gamma/tau